jgi:hypothetical protein
MNLPDGLGYRREDIDRISRVGLDTRPFDDEIWGNESLTEIWPDLEGRVLSIRLAYPSRA